MLSRRDFVRRGALWTLAAALVDPAEAIERLTWRRKSFPSGSILSDGKYVYCTDRYGNRVTPYQPADAYDHVQMVAPGAPSVVINTVYTVKLVELGHYGWEHQRETTLLQFCTPAGGHLHVTPPWDNPRSPRSIRVLT